MGEIMNRFRGEYTYTVDVKGRFNIPAKFRKALSPEANEGFVVSRAPDGCLRAYPLDEWDRAEDNLLSRPENPQTVKLKRLIYSTLSESKLDGQGRITLSPTQMGIAGISKNVLLIGHRGYIEIWDPDKFAAYRGSEDDFNEAFYQSVEAGTKNQ